MVLVRSDSASFSCQTSPAASPAICIGSPLPDDEVVVDDLAGEVGAERLRRRGVQPGEECIVDAVRSGYRGQGSVLVKLPEQHPAGSDQLGDAPGQAAVEIAEGRPGSCVVGHGYQRVERQPV